MNRRMLPLLAIVTLLGGTAALAQRLDEGILDLGDEAVGTWFDHALRTRIAETTGDPDVDAGSLLEEAKSRIEAQVNGNCDGPEDEAQARACAYIANLSAYGEFLSAERFCRIQPVLSEVSDPSQPSGTIMAAVSATTTPADFAGLDLFAFTRVGSQFPMFETAPIEARCGTGTLRFTPIAVPAASTATTDKLVLAYSYALSLETFEHNRRNMEAVAELIAQANERWSNFEVNVIHDQYPWETLLFNDWLAGASSRFRGTLTHPPTQQIRAIHPVPTAVLNVTGDHMLFRPRVTVEVIGLRYLNEGTYTLKRAISVITTLRAEDGESNGWGLLYTWRRGSIGLIHQEVDFDDDIVGLVFGIDLANQINSGPNQMMKEWESLRQDLRSTNDRQ